MRYNYETLNEYTFQQLVQALIVRQHPQVQCLPVAQPDGGRDAFAFHVHPEGTGFVVFQVKFSRNPSAKDEREVILDLIKTETPKVNELVTRGATKYYLITNVQGTAHLESGSIDRAHGALTEALNIPAQVWWRDDIDRRLDDAPDIQWSYADVLSAADVLSLFARQFGVLPDLGSARTLKRYLADQYVADREVKFKQVDLKRTLTDLFVDLPLREKGWHYDPERRQPTPKGLAQELDSYLNQLRVPDDQDEEVTYHLNHSGLAAAFFLQMPLATGVSKFVLEGAPGQGKSTVTQFLCQVNRLRLLHKTSELDAIENKHKGGPVRAPFRIDLRDYAAWVTGRHPFNKNEQAYVPPEGRRSLESFIAMQVAWQSAAPTMTEDELFQFLERSDCVIVLDGFDEVADIATRTRLIGELCRSAERFGAHCRSLQIIVTSRPAAFASSPGFPEDDWIHLELRNLKRANIEAYRDKWLAAQGLTAEERGMVTSTLADKLDQPHLRDLARNPMQLAILLHLIHVQGAALPEKRTTLYEEYMKLFFNREAEKSVVVRDHRELLLAIHGVLAWQLQVQSEEGSGSGSLTKDALRAQVRAFLETEEYDSKLADELFAGTVERVGALVSRVEGTFEFEVQPLREYFAGRYLYKTAPYSPPGRKRSGTRPERLDALARSSYWTNVTRFFCGFYDVGELGTLVDGLLQLDEQGGYGLTNQPRRLIMMLLADHVFSQSPRAMKRLVSYVLEWPGFRRLAATIGLRGGQGMALPESAGRRILLAACDQVLEGEVDPARRGSVRRLMSHNGTWRELKERWRDQFRGGLAAADAWQAAMDFGITTRFDRDEIGEFAGGDLGREVRWLTWADHQLALAERPELRDAARREFFDGRLMFFRRRPFDSDGVSDFDVLGQYLNIYMLVGLLEEGSGGNHAHRFMERTGFLYGESHGRGSGDADEDSVGTFARFLVRLFQSDFDGWRTELSRWCELVDRGFEVAPGSELLVGVSAIASGVTAGDEEGVWDGDGFGATQGLVGRVYFARWKGGNPEWWRAQLANAGDETLELLLTLVLAWGTPDTLRELKAELTAAVMGLEGARWVRLCSLVDCVGIGAAGQRTRLEASWFETGEELEARVARVIVGRVEDPVERRRVSRRVFGTYVGTDMEILRCAAECEGVGRGGDDVDWGLVGRLSGLAQRNGARMMLGLRELGTDVEVPADVSAEVLRKCEEHCDELVEMCERSYGRRVAESAEKVSIVAERDEWFGSEGH